MAPNLSMIVFVIFIFLASTFCDDSFDEKLIIKPLKDGMVLAHFEFTTVWDEDVRNINFAKNFHLFPMSTGKFLGKHEIQELHFSLTKGLWKHARWGYPPRDAGPGAELWLWFQPHKRDPVRGWKEVTSLLSGQFCASLNFIDTAASVQPKHSLRPEGVTKSNFRDSEFSQKSVFYAALPHETVCTENLTPWKKLLPCFGKSGLASLLNAVHVLNTNYFSLALDIIPKCKDDSCKLTSIEMKQSLTVVFNTPAMFEGKQSWSLFKIFGGALSTICPLATSSNIYVDISRNETDNPHTLTPPPTRVIQHEIYGQGTQKYAIYDLNKKDEIIGNSTSRALNLVCQYKKEHNYEVVEPPPVVITRSVVGSGVSGGGILSLIQNKLKTDVKIMVLEVIPWYFRIYLHTLKIEADGVVLKPVQLFYHPALDRSRPHHLEFGLVLPASSVTKISIEFDRQHLRWTEYPPDANHGVYIASGIVTLVLPQSNNMTIIPSSTSSLMEKPRFVRIHSPCLLVSLATPDFSMPYNVICLVSTVISLAFGHLHKLTTMVVVEVDPKEADSTQNLSLFQRLVRKFRKSKKEEKVEEESESKKEK